MSASKDRISFLSLSAESRNYIYELAMTPDEHNAEDRETYEWLDGEPAVVLQSRGVEWNGFDPTPLKFWVQPGVTRVSRQVRKESLSLYYGCTKFLIYIPHLDDGCGQRVFYFFDRVRESSCTFIKHIELFYWCGEWYTDQEIKKDVLEIFDTKESQFCVRAERALDGSGRPLWARSHDSEEVANENWVYIDMSV